MTPRWTSTIRDGNLVSDDPSVRLLYAICAEQFVNAANGVIRTDALRRTRLMPRYVGGDYRIMAELSLQGKFVEIPEHLYVRRIHSGSTKGNAENSEWLRRYYVGTGAGVRAPYWHLCRDHVGIVVRAPIPPRKWCCSHSWLARWLRAHPACSASWPAAAEREREHDRGREHLMETE